jgi:hypothetical protein
MAERAYQWLMANGSRVLFSIAVIVFGVALTESVVTAASRQLSPVTGEMFYRFDWSTFLEHLLLVFQVPVWPLTGAIVVHVLERRQKP